MTNGVVAIAAGRLSLRRALLMGVSTAALSTPVHAAGPAPFSAGWYALKGAGGPAASAAIANAVAGAGMNSKSYAQVRQSLANLQHSAQAIAAMHALQSQAHAIVAAGQLPDGLRAGGLVPDTGLAAPGVAAPVASWTGAAAPLQTGPAAMPTVTVRQTAPSALLNWRTLNVGARTTLAFDQSAGGAAAPTWVALNRVRDPNLAPTQILGHVTAQGHVIVVNGSGIIFSPTAQVTVGSLIASTASISDGQFRANGIYSADGTPTFTGATAPVLVAPGARIATTAPLTATSAGGGVILLGSDVTNGGDIETPDGQAVLGAGRDFVLQQGYGVAKSGQQYGSVTNALAGNLSSQAGFGPGGTIVETVQGTAIAVAAGGGKATNQGLVEADRGDVTLVGQTVTQAGVAVSTTTVSTRGTIHLLTDQTDPKSSVTLAPGSVTSILPDPASNTALDAQRAADIANSTNADIVRFDNPPPLNDQPALPDNQYQSLIQIVSGNIVDAGGGSLAMSQGGQIQIAAPGRVLVETGAQLDVSGTVGVPLPMSANNVAVSVQGFNLRDNPLNRDTTLLNNATVYVDTRSLVSAPASPAYANSPYTTAGAGRLYTPGGLFEVSGEVSNLPHTIGEWTSAGGTILISGGASGQVVAQPGSVFNLAGGSIDYQAGALKLTWLIGPQGRLYNASTAPSTLVYTGVYGGETFTHRRWAISQTYNDPLITPGSVQSPGYVEGRDGGTLEISAPTAVLEGTIDAGVITGPLQTQPRASSITDPYLQPPSAVPLPGQLLIGDYGALGYGSAGLAGGYDTTVTFQAGGAPIAASLGLTTPVPAARTDTAILDANALDVAGLGAIGVTTQGAVTVASPLTLANAGQLTLNAAGVDVDANVTARSGSVTLGDVISVPGNVLKVSLVPTFTVASGATVPRENALVELAPGVAIDLRGQWTNTLIDPVHLAGEAAVAGGSLTVDTTGGITLAPGSLVDASAGGVVSRTGAFTGGAGGGVSLIGDDPGGNPLFAVGTATSVLPVALAGTIRSFGAAAGGSFILRAPSVLIAGAPASTGLDAEGRTVLTPALFQQGFASYSIDGYGDLPTVNTGAIEVPFAPPATPAAPGTNPFLPGVELAAGVAIDPVVPVTLANAGSLLAPTGSNPETAASLYLPPAYLQNQTSATLTPRPGASLSLLSRTFSPVQAQNLGSLDGGGAITIDQGSSIAVDAGQAVSIEAVGQITIDGAIAAPGGTVVGSAGVEGISILNDTFEPGTGAGIANYVPGLSIWIGPNATLNTSSVADTASDLFGRAYGVAPNAGPITVGGAQIVQPPGTNKSTSAYPVSTDATVVIRPGALLDATGSAAEIDLSAGSGAATTANRVSLAGNGGAISLNSTSGIVIDGTLRAAQGGPTAAGGSLEVDLVTPVYGETVQSVTLVGVPDALRVGRQIVISQKPLPSVLPATLLPTQSLSSVFGVVQLAADSLMAEGFGSLTVAGNAFTSGSFPFGPTDVMFDGPVSLKLAARIDIPAQLTTTDGSNVVRLSAPYVVLNSNAAVNYFHAPPTASNLTTQNVGQYNSVLSGGVSPVTAAGSNLSIETNQLSIGSGTIGGLNFTNLLNAPADATANPTLLIHSLGFASASFSSKGDTQLDGTFLAGGNLSLTAAQIYPIAPSTIALSIDQNLSTNPSGPVPTVPPPRPGILALTRTPGTDPAPPLIVGQSLALIAGTIEQGGVVRAPLGQITLGYENQSGLLLPASGFTDRVAFLPGSVTSVSAAGQTVLYGGTQDGVNYDVNYTGSGPLSATPPSFAPAITIAAQSTALDAGGTLDLRGGGTLAGAGFNSGRGGSTDVLTAPFLQISGGIASPAASNMVYAIVPGFTGTTPPAPTTAFAYSSNVAPATGSQITTVAGIPGLPAATYTLLPAYDALLPGAFRVELQPGIHPLGPAVAQVGNLSTQVGATRSVAGTSARDTQPIGVLVTPGSAVRRLSSYDEETVSAFALAQAALAGYPRGAIAADAGLLRLNYDITVPPLFLRQGPALSVAGNALFQPGDGGRGGTVEVDTDPTEGSHIANIDIVGDTGAGVQLGGSQYPVDTVVLRAADLDRLAPENLSIGGAVTVPAGAAAIDYGLPNAPSASIEVERGATLSAPQVFLLASSSVTLKSGASIDILASGATTSGASINLPYLNGQGATPADAALIASNATLSFLAPGITGSRSDAVTIENGASVFSQGTFAIDTPGSVSIGNQAAFAARNLFFAVSNVNLLPAANLAPGTVKPNGLDLTQTQLDQLVAGGIVAGAPALQQVRFLATNAINFFGNSGLDLSGGSGNRTLEFDTPSIYGVGAPGDVATVRAGTFIWNGVAVPNTAPNGGLLPAVAGGQNTPQTYASAPAAPVLLDGPGTGQGSLVVDASNIVLGYAPGQVASTPALTGGPPSLSRTTYGFSTVSLIATRQVSANSAGTLSVYAAQGPYAGGSYRNSGGTLDIVTPLLTNSAGATLAVDAGGAVAITSTGGLTGPAAGLGGEIDLSGASIDLATAVALPEGKLVLTAAGDITLGAGAAIDLAGVGTVFFDQTRAGPGGILIAESTSGGIAADPASRIDVSSPGAAAGRIDASAPAGNVSLGGSFLGGGGTAARIAVRAGTLSDFAGLDQRLTDGDVTGSRGFEIGSGDLTVTSADRVRASSVNISLDSGSLTIDGLIDASGAAPGSISLSAGRNLTLTPNAVLDAHGTVAQTDSAGRTIDSENTASVTLRVADGPNGTNLASTGANGVLTIAPNARIDVSAPAGVTCALGACGRVELDVPRIGAMDGTSGDLAISAGGPIDVRGAGSIAVAGFWSYAPPDGLITQTNTGANADPNGIGLDQIDRANAAFIASAEPGGGLAPVLAAKLAGLTAYAGALHLRPGVEIDSSTASGGNLTVNGDLDLSGLRYASLDQSNRLDPSTYGSGEPGVLVLRAANNLTVYGSITDGFAQPVDTAANQNPDDQGWILQGFQTIDQNIIVPLGADPVDVSGSTFPNVAIPLNYDLNVAGGPSILPGTVLPTSITLSNPITVPTAGIVAQADVTAPDGQTILFAKGVAIAGGTTLPAGASLGAGFLLFAPTGGVQVNFDAINVLTGQPQTWPAGASLAAFSNPISLTSSQPLTAGDLIPVGTQLNFANSSQVNLRQPGTLPNGLPGQGEIYGASNLLPPGSLSWSIVLAGGANTAAADPAGLTPASVLAARGNTGNLTLSDLHFAQIVPPGFVPGPFSTPLAYAPAFSVVRTGTGSLSLLAGGTLNEASTYGIYTAGTQSPGVNGTPFDQRGTAYSFADPTVASGPEAAVYAAINASYPQGGGNLTLAAQADLLTTSLPQIDISNSRTTLTTSQTGAWINRQGDGSAANPGAWWVNFGTYEPITTMSNENPPTTDVLPLLLGFTGIGTLGGGDLSVSAGGNAGVTSQQVIANFQSGIPISDTNGDTLNTIHNSSLSLAIGSTGRETSSGLVLTGGGRLSLDVGNVLDPMSNALGIETSTAQSTILSLRGDVAITAGRVASVNGSVGLGSVTNNPYTASVLAGPELILGDATATIATRGDLSLGSTGDATREQTLYVSPNGATSWFSLWQPTTAVNLFSAGGDISPAVVSQPGSIYYPPTLSVVAASGSVYSLVAGSTAGGVLETAPSPTGQFEFLAGNSLVGGTGSIIGQNAGPGEVLAASGADPSLLASVANPAFTGETGTAVAQNTIAATGSLFAFSTDTPTGFLHAADTQPARFYAASGDIENFSTGLVNGGTQYLAAKPVRVLAGNDIVGLDQVAGSGILWNNTANDISEISAGNDIFYANAQVTGPGLLEVAAGHNLDQGNFGNLTSLGYVVGKTVATQDLGAGITVTAGVTPGNIDLAGFAALYFDPTHLANPAVPLQNQPGRVERTYQAQLLAFLQQRTGYTGGPSGALAAFQALPADVRQILTLQVYYAELNQSGLDFSDPASRFYRSYSEGTEAIHALFPATDLTGQSPASGGSLTLTGGSGISTQFGGAIQIVDPFGATAIGVPGPVPPPTSGVVTQGTGSVDIYSYGSVLLGQSRIFTTFGGDLLIWLEGNGEINGGQGSKSTIVFTPPTIQYDTVGDISLSPTVPSTGAGLAVLAPVAGVPPGNINLVSPFGTIDAGEAGIRSSGNINLVALTILNAANVQAGGKVSGVPVAAVPNVAAITAASAASGAAQNAGQNNLKPAASQKTPSIITVDIVGSDQCGAQNEKPCPDEKKRKHKT